MCLSVCVYLWTLLIKIKYKWKKSDNIYPVSDQCTATSILIRRNCFLEGFVSCRCINKYLMQASSHPAAFKQQQITHATHATLSQVPPAFFTKSMQITFLAWWLAGSHEKVTCRKRSKLFARYVKQRLDDQARQNITASINNSTRFQTLAMLKKNPSTRSEYLDNVSDPIKRQVITRLRIDLNKLATCRA